jgi:hypothetical protein
MGGTQTFQNAAGSKTMLVLNSANSVDLNYNNSTKFQTTNTGISVTGNVVPSGNISGSSTSTGSFGHVKLGDYNAPRTLEITAGNNEDAEIRLHNTDNTIGHSIVMNDSNNRAMYFKYHNGSATGTAYMTFDGANGNVGIGGAIDPNTDLQVGGYSGTRAVTIATGNNEDAELRFHNTNNTIGHSIVFNDSTGRSLYFKRHSASATGTTYMTMNGTTGDVEFANNVSGSSTSHLTMAQVSSSGDVVADGDVIAYNSSDVRLKDNIQVIKGSLDKIDGIRGVEFDWNDKSPGWAQERGHDIGVIAQEVQKVIPEIVVERKNGYLGVDYKRLVPLLIESVKELRQEVEDLKKKVN